MKVGRRLAAVALVAAIGCVGEPKTPAERAHTVGDPEQSSDESAPKGELTEEDCNQRPEGAAPFDRPVADGMLKRGMERAWDCGLHNVSSFDLSLTLTWGPSGCVSDVRLESKVPSSTGECLIRRFRQSTIKPFKGNPVAVRVRMTNDRAWYEWLGEVTAGADEER